MSDSALLEFSCEHEAQSLVFKSRFVFLEAVLTLCKFGEGFGVSLGLAAQVLLEVLHPMLHSGGLPVRHKFRDAARQSGA